MSELIVKTIDDLHHGRTSWRVYALLNIPALIAGFIAGVLH